MDALYLLLRGRCQVLHPQPGGGERLVRTLGEGDMFGEIALMLGLSATATVRAETS
ncbi:cyclic nucleotide-binding domain-containing protein [Archangium lansingense]|uniref:Cyclic nucleotide-binding domain-containing protein n=1 Tax=Archangium lansingense TaxID=2995310 RepID=A0ABT3ZXF9_9BACT|nr:cyclic nucleotide-binding domain-containing protein [Archangium lansinium]MCY1074063.1 cyclic nucleotide-binding domain-containing protein [Archangium lansinium]